MGFLAAVRSQLVPYCHALLPLWGFSAWLRLSWQCCLNERQRSTGTYSPTDKVGIKLVWEGGGSRNSQAVKDIFLSLCPGLFLIRRECGVCQERESGLPHGHTRTYSFICLCTHSEPRPLLTYSCMCLFPEHGVSAEPLCSPQTSLQGL